MKNNKKHESGGAVVGVISLGCSKNRVNTEQMMFLLSSAGYMITGETDGVDIILINTCGFIESAKEEAFETINKLIADKAAGKIGKIIVAGCMPQRHKESIIEELPEIDAIVGTGSFDDIVDVIEKAQGDGSLVLSKESKRTVPLCSFGDIDAPISETPRVLSTSTVWAYLKIAEGCDNRCAYCSIPDIRGKFRSRPIENIVDEAKKLADSGILEIILVAQDLTMYGLDLYGERRLSFLLGELNKIKKIKWIRLHYLYPDGFDDGLIDVIAKSDKILKYIDIPIQHINDGILTKMRRRGSGKQIRELINKLRERIDGVVLRTSLITGLPGETDKEFEELFNFLRETKIERFGVFPFSPEDGTDAALMERVSEETAVWRANKLMQLQSDIMYLWNNKRVGTITDVIIEDFSTEINGKEYHLARSYAESPEIDGYIAVHEASLEDNPDSLNYTKQKKAARLCACYITQTQSGELIGELI